MFDAERLFSRDNVFQPDEKFFYQLLTAVHYYHCNNNRFYEDYSDLRKRIKIPFLFADIFKENKLITGDENRIIAVVTTSGKSTGILGRIYLDDLTLKRRLAGNKRNTLEFFNFIPETPILDLCPFNCFQYPQEREIRLLRAESNRISYNKIYHCWRMTEETPFFDHEMALTLIEQHSKAQNPLIIFTRPEILTDIMEQIPSLPLARDSFIITTGGWSVELTREGFEEICRQKFSINPKNMTDQYYFAENGQIFNCCEYKNFHIPVYSDVVCLSGETFQPLPLGETGLLDFISPMNHSYPGISLISGDEGMLGKDCPCKRPGKYFHIHRRIPKDEINLLRKKELALFT